MIKADLYILLLLISFPTPPPILFYLLITLLYCLNFKGKHNCSGQWGPIGINSKLEYSLKNPILTINISKNDTCVSKKNKKKKTWKMENQARR